MVERSFGLGASAGAASLELAFIVTLIAVLLVSAVAQIQTTLGGAFVLANVGNNGQLVDGGTEEGVDGECGYSMTTGVCDDDPPEP